MADKERDESGHRKKRKSSRERSHHRKRRRSTSRSKEVEDPSEEHRHHRHDHRSRSSNKRKHGDDSQELSSRSSKHKHRKHSHRDHHHRSKDKKRSQARHRSPPPSSDEAQHENTKNSVKTEAAATLGAATALSSPIQPLAAADSLAVGGTKVIATEGGRPRTLVHYIQDREKMCSEAFSMFTPTVIDRLLPKSLQGFSLEKVEEACCRQIGNLSEEQLREVIEEGRLYSEEELGFELVKVAPLQQSTPQASNRVEGGEMVSHSPAEVQALSPKATCSVDGDEVESGALVEVMVSENLFDLPSTTSPVRPATADSTSSASAPSEEMTLMELQKKKRKLEAQLKQNYSASSASPSSHRHSAPEQVQKPEKVVMIISSPDSSPTPRQRPKRQVAFNPITVSDSECTTEVSHCPESGARSQSAGVGNGNGTGDSQRSTGLASRKVGMEKEEQLLRLRALKSMNKRLLSMKGKALS